MYLSSLSSPLMLLRPPPLCIASVAIARSGHWACTPRNPVLAIGEVSFDFAHWALTTRRTAILTMTSCPFPQAKEQSIHILSGTSYARVISGCRRCIDAHELPTSLSLVAGLRKFADVTLRTSARSFFSPAPCIRSSIPHATPDSHPLD